MNSMYLCSDACPTDSEYQFINTTKFCVSTCLFFVVEGLKLNCKDNIDDCSKLTPNTLLNYYDEDKLAT